MQTWNTALHPVAAGENTKDKFLLNGDPSTVFNKAHMTASFANKAADCAVPDYVTSFDNYNAEALFEFDYDAFQESPQCNSSANLDYLGYDAESGHGLFRTSLDVNTVVVAAAVS